MKHILKRTALCLTASAFLLWPVSVLAGAGGTDVKMADEYGMIQEGKWPKEVTFSDTAFTNQVHTSTASVLSELNDVQTKEHTFTVKAGDRVNFDLKGSHYGPVIPENESLVFWALKNSGYRCAAVRIPNDGLYLIRKGLDSYDMKVTDFGFDTDLSDLSAHVSITMNMDAEKVMSEAEIPAVPGESFSHDFPDLFTKDRKFKDSVLITAEGNAHVSPVNKEDTTVYLTDRYDMTLKESDSMGFQFILDEGAKWSFSLNGTSFTPELVSYDYNIVWENYPSAAGETQVYNADALVYRTLSIVLVDSDLKERESTVVDKWLKEEEEWERRRNE
ncbi:MAG: hypothetical protein K6A40_08310, partial [Solobacterium sp.]|nr:hypothetical protein [Solobacterium sp.]